MESVEPPLETTTSPGSVQSATKEPSPRASPIAPPHQRASSLSASPSAVRSESRPASFTTSASQARKRLSVSFPILPANSNISPRNLSPTTSTATTTTTTTSSPSSSYLSGTPGISDITPDEPMAFLTALAAQERRVLELREELGKAETELGKMKKQWALHEATRKVHELPTPAERLRPLNTSLGGSEDQRDRMISPTREQYNARKATLNSLNGTSTRKVLPSQRHQRTLSLLSPDRTSYKQPFPQPSDEGPKTTSETPPTSIRRSQTFIQSSSTLSSAASLIPVRPLSLSDFPIPSAKQKGQDALIRTGKQMAEDFKEGLWTFLEDIRQATVGDEGTQPSLSPPGKRATSNHAMKRQSSRASIRSNSSGKVQREASNSPAKDLIDFGADDSKDTPDGSKDPSPPSARWSTTSTVLSDIPGTMTPPSRSSTPRTSTRYIYPIYPHSLYPQTNKINFSSVASNSNGNTQLWNSVISTQFNLKKTATAILAGVEKSLAPLPPHEPATTGFYAPGKDTGHLRSRSISPQLKSKKA